MFCSSSKFRFGVICSFIIVIYNGNGHEWSPIRSVIIPGGLLGSIFAGYVPLASSLS